MTEHRNFGCRVASLGLLVLLLTCLFAIADFCTQCGVRLPDGARFCPKCGSKVVVVPDAPPPPPPRKTPPRVIEAPPPPAEDVKDDGSLATVAISRTYETKQDARGQWQISLDKIDLKESTFLDIKRQFEKLMWDKAVEGHYLEYFFEKFMILDRDGKLNFAYKAIRVYDKNGARRMQSKPGSADTAYWHNDISGKVYELTIDDRTIKINEFKE